MDQILTDPRRFVTRTVIDPQIWTKMTDFGAFCEKKLAIPFPGTILYVPHATILSAGCQLLSQRRSRGAHSYILMGRKLKFVNYCTIPASLADMKCNRARVICLNCISYFQNDALVELIAIF
jgi:hypothetical protein